VFGFNRLIIEVNLTVRCESLAMPNNYGIFTCFLLEAQQLVIECLL
jgi:hypothetical protein